MNKELILTQLIELVKDEPNTIANLSNISAFLNGYFDDINWVGFYLYDGSELVLGPFQGNVACVRIPIGKGVCGTSIYQNRIIRVENVHQFPGHIACDSQSKSEIVLPIIKDSNIYGVLDIDSPNYNRFTQQDEDFLIEVVNIIKKYVFTK